MKTRVFVLCLVAVSACATTAPPRSTDDIVGQCNATCDRNPRPNCEQSCDQRLMNCMQACGCPFSQDTLQTTFDARTGRVRGHALVRIR